MLNEDECGGGERKEGSRRVLEKAELGKVRNFMWSLFYLSMFCCLGGGSQALNPSPDCSCQPATTFFIIIIIDIIAVVVVSVVSLGYFMPTLEVLKYLACT